MDFGHWLILIILGTIVGVIYWINRLINESTKRKDMTQGLSDIPDFSIRYKLMGEDGNTGIAVDEGRKKICLIHHTGYAKTYPTLETRVFSYKDILSCEIIENGIAVIKTSRTNQIGSALISGLAFETLGTVVGGLPKKEVSSRKVKRIDMWLMVNDTKRPTHTVNFQNTEHKKGGIVYNQAMDKVRWWYALMETLIRQADTEDKSALEWLKKGQKLYKSGNYQEAIGAYTNAIDLAPKYALAYFNRGATYHKLGNLKHTVNDLKISAKLGNRKAQDLLKSKGVDWSTNPADTRKTTIKRVP